jgi:hypothetical protein
MTITKLEAGKTYKLIDKAGWFKINVENRDIYDTYFTGDTVPVTSVDNDGYGWFCEVAVITPCEFEFFEEIAETKKTFKYSVQRVDKFCKDFVQHSEIRAFDDFEGAEKYISSLYDEDELKDHEISYNIIVKRKKDNK